MNQRTTRIVSKVLHHLDIENSLCNAIPIPAVSDVGPYLVSLLQEIQTRAQRQEYYLASNTTEFAQCLTSFFANKDLEKTPQAEALARRLLRTELDTEGKYGHLSFGLWRRCALY